MTSAADGSAELARLRELAAEQPKAAGAELVALAGALKRPEHIMSLADIIGKLVPSTHGLRTMRLAIAGDVTLNGIAAAAVVALAGEGIVATSYSSPFGAYQQEILNPNSGLYAFKPDIVLLVPQRHVQADLLEESDVNEWSENSISEFRNLWTVLAERLPGIRILQHLYETPNEDFLGPAERRLSWTGLRLTEYLNTRLMAEAPGFVHFIDIDRLSGRIGRQNWYDQRLWFYGKVPFAFKYLGDYRVVMSASMRRVLGKSRKALIVDLDNTLWQGVIGDDGLNGIRLGPGSPAGEAHQAFCEYVKALGRRGVILGICSKNDPSIALKVFEEHPHMPLRRDAFAVVECNWDDKASNLRRVAAELNIDLSAIVFADDNEAECELIRRELPSVTVVPLTGDPSEFCRKLDGMRLFEADALSAEDLKRQASYRGRREAGAARTAAKSIDEYLTSLEMRGRLWGAREEDVTRLAQMEGKTNQFNLTTRRWSADQLRQFAAATDYEVLCFRLADRFADHGLVSSVVLKFEGDVATIASWLMSCRVFSRTAEEFILNGILDRAAIRGAASIVGVYSRTEKNGFVDGLFPRLGFEPRNAGFYLAVSPDARKRTFIKDDA